MKKFIQSIVDRRVNTNPIYGITKDSFQWVGMLFGGIYGFKESLRNDNGVIWRPSIGVMVGGCVGYTVGLFPIHVFGLLFSGDVVYTRLYGSYRSYGSYGSYGAMGTMGTNGQNNKLDG